jgi:hypothetical protein
VDKPISSPQYSLQEEADEIVLHNIVYAMDAVQAYVVDARSRKTKAEPTCGD